MLLGFEMPSWFDLMTLDATGPEDEAGIKSASALVSFCFGLLLLRGIEHIFCCHGSIFL